MNIEDIIGQSFIGYLIYFTQLSSDLLASLPVL